MRFEQKPIVYHLCAKFEANSAGIGFMVNLCLNTIHVELKQAFTIYIISTKVVLLYLIIRKFSSSSAGHIRHTTFLTLKCVCILLITIFFFNALQ